MCVCVAEITGMRTTLPKCRPNLIVRPKEESIPGMNECTTVEIRDKTVTNGHKWQGGKSGNERWSMTRGRRVAKEV